MKKMQKIKKYYILLSPNFILFFILFLFFIWLEDPHLTYKHSAQDCIAS